MDQISGVSDNELLVKILSFLPTKVAVSTGVLSKEWNSLWKRVLKLEYDDTESKTKPSKSQKRFRRFVKRNLVIDRDSALESLSLKFSTAPFQPEDIRSWVGFAVSRGVHQLSISYSSNLWHPGELPLSLYTCKSLVSLKIEEKISFYVPRIVCLPSLRTLQLQFREYHYYDKDALQRLLSNCPVLENLSVKNTERSTSFTKFSVIVPSLQSLSLEIDDVIEIDDVSNYNLYVIDTPSLRYLKIKDQYNCYPCSIENMPKLEEAYLDVLFPNINNLLESIASVNRLSLCLTVNSAQDLYSGGIVFSQLEHLKLCTCNTYWSRILVRLLEDSPKLRVLELYVNEHSPFSRAPMVYWKDQLSYVPQCFVTSLETFRWIGCEGRQEERDMITYILNYARCLKNATVLTDESRIDPQRKLEMIDKLTLSSLASTTCKLTF